MACPSAAWLLRGLNHDFGLATVVHDAKPQWVMSAVLEVLAGLTYAYWIVAIQ